MSWSTTVKLYEQNGPTDYETMNGPIQDLIARTDWLKQQVDQITAGENLIGTFSNLDASTAVGDAVYVDTATGTVKQALAKFKSEYANDGSLRLADSAYILGIVIEKLNATSGRILIAGTIEDQALADAALGVSAPAGIYRLSMTNAGELTATEQDLDILAVQYQGGGVMALFDKRAAIPNHMHRTYVLSASWLLENDVQFDDMVKPVGATYGYDLSSDADVAALFTGPASLFRIYGDGALLLETEVVSNEDNIWWVDAVSVPTDYTNLEAVITTPYTFGEPILRGARTDTPTEIELSAAQGILTANMAAWTTQDVAVTGKAVVALNGRVADLADVITSVNVVGTLQKTQDGVGGVTISLGQGINSFIEPRIVNLNSAIEASDGVLVYYALPAGRNSNMIGRISLPYFTGSLNAAVVAEVQALAAGGAYPQLDIGYATVPYADTEQALPGALTTFQLPADVVNINKLQIIEADIGDRFAVTSRGSIFLKIGYNTPSEDLKIHRFGVVLYTP